MFWLSYYCILCDAFLVKSVISSHNNCDIWLYNNFTLHPRTSFLLWKCGCRKKKYRGLNAKFCEIFFSIISPFRQWKLMKRNKGYGTIFFFLQRVWSLNVCQKQLILVVFCRKRFPKNFATFTIFPVGNLRKISKSKTRRRLHGIVTLVLYT